MPDITPRTPATGKAPVPGWYGLEFTGRIEQIEDPYAGFKTLRERQPVLR